MNPQQEYDYTQSGFDGFMSRGVDGSAMMNLNSPLPVSYQIPYDRMQVSGPLQDTIQIGGVRIERQAIIINDGENDFFIAGDDEA